MSLAKAAPAKRAMVAARMVVNCIFAVVWDRIVSALLGKGGRRGGVRLFEVWRGVS